MKKFFTNIPLQQPGLLKSGVYKAVGNERLSMDSACSFPILHAVNGYAVPGEAFRVIALKGDSKAESWNLDILRRELEELCRERGFAAPEVETVKAEAGQDVLSQLTMFRRLIALSEDGDELSACLTYGTKIQSMTLLTAIRYAYRLKADTTIDCIVYGQVDWGNTGAGNRVYDETAMIQLDEITRMLAERGVSDPEKAIDAILDL